MEVIATTNAPKALGPYSQAVLAGSILFVSSLCSPPHLHIATRTPVRLLLIRKQVKWFKALLKLKLSRF